MNEILGRSHCGPIVFGCHAPDSGNAEILAHYGTPELKAALPRAAAEQRDRVRVLDDRAGRRLRPDRLRTTAELDGDEWVINGEKWFSSHARFASFLIVLAVTEPDAPPHRRMSMFVVPRRHARRGDHPQRRDVRPPRRGHPRLRALHRRADPRRPSPRRARSRASPWRRPASAAAASTTPCAPSDWSARRSTPCASGRCPAGPRARHSPASSWSRR